MYLPVQMVMPSTPALATSGTIPVEKYFRAANGNFCELTGLYWAAHNIDSDYIGIVHYRRYFASRRKMLLCGQEVTCHQP